jgi:type IV pilus assembly protein PilV
MHISNRCFQRAATRGFSLIEVLMALLVLAVGLSGMMRMHLAALRAQQQSADRAGALQLATEMAEMIRAYRAPAGDTPFLFDYRSGDPIAATGDCYGSARCDPAALRAFGIGRWLDAVHATLPSARVRICRDATPWQAGRTAYGWPCSGDAGAGIAIKIGWRASDEASAAADAPAPQLVLGAGAAGS